MIKRTMDDRIAIAVEEGRKPMGRGQAYLDEFMEIRAEKGVKVRVVRPETPEEYHGRPFDRLTIHIFGRCWTIKIPRLFQGFFKRRP